MGITETSIRQPERTEIEIADRAHVDEFLEQKYGAKLRLSLQPTAPRPGPVLTYARTAVGPFAIDELGLAGGGEASPDPLNTVVVIWAQGGKVAASCDGLTGEAGMGEVTM